MPPVFIQEPTVRIPRTRRASSAAWKWRMLSTLLPDVPCCSRNEHASLRLPLRLLRHGCLTPPPALATIATLCLCRSCWAHVGSRIRRYSGSALNFSRSYELLEQTSCSVKYGPIGTTLPLRMRRQERFYPRCHDNLMTHVNHMCIASVFSNSAAERQPGFNLCLQLTLVAHCLLKTPKNLVLLRWLIDESFPLSA